VETINKCYISATVQNKMFDHRAVAICMKPKRRQIRIPTISRELLKDPDIDLVVKLSFCDTYVLHTVILTDPERKRLLRLIGTSKKLLRDAGPDSEILLVGERTDFEELKRSGTIAEIELNLDLIPIDRLLAGGFTDNLEDDIFMETLVNNLKNDCVSYQTFISRTIKNTISSSIRQLDDLKQDHRTNQDAIFELEKKLNRIQDRKMRSKLEGSKNFEILNNEKITPNFINLSKGSKSEASLSDLKNENGLDFGSEEDRKEYVRDFYKKLYKSPDCDRVFSDTCIEDFLGEEILNSRLVQDSKIPVDISDNFENPLTIEELDKSAEQGNRSGFELLYKKVLGIFTSPLA
jgi:hypothetical protein